MATILLVDDEADIRRLARMMLEQDGGYTVLEARSTDEALRVCQETAGPISLLLIDLVLPGMNGRELQDRLLAVHPEAKVLYMSGHKDYAIGPQGVLEGEANFISKPFTTEALNQAVCNVLRSG